MDSKKSEREEKLLSLQTQLPFLECLLERFRTKNILDRYNKIIRLKDIITSNSSDLATLSKVEKAIQSIRKGLEKDTALNNALLRAESLASQVIIKTEPISIKCEQIKIKREPISQPLVTDEIVELSDDEVQFVPDSSDESNSEAPSVIKSQITIKQEISSKQELTSIPGGSPSGSSKLNTESSDSNSAKTSNKSEYSISDIVSPGIPKRQLINVKFKTKDSSNFVDVSNKKMNVAGKVDANESEIGVKTEGDKHKKNTDIIKNESIALLNPDPDKIPEKHNEESQQSKLKRNESMVPVPEDPNLTSCSMSATPIKHKTSPSDEFWSRLGIPIKTDKKPLVNKDTDSITNCSLRNVEEISKSISSDTGSISSEALRKILCDSEDGATHAKNCEETVKSNIDKITTAESSVANSVSVVDAMMNHSKDRTNDMAANPSTPVENIPPRTSRLNNIIANLERNLCTNNSSLNEAPTECSSVNIIAGSDSTIGTRLAPKTSTNLDDSIVDGANFAKQEVKSVIVVEKSSELEILQESISEKSDDQLPEGCQAVLSTTVKTTDPSVGDVDHIFKSTINLRVGSKDISTECLVTDSMVSEKQSEMKKIDASSADDVQKKTTINGTNLPKNISKDSQQNFLTLCTNEIQTVEKNSVEGAANCVSKGTKVVGVGSETTTDLNANLKKDNLNCLSSTKDSVNKDVQHTIDDLPKNILKDEKDRLKLHKSKILEVPLITSKLGEMSTPNTNKKETKKSAPNLPSNDSKVADLLSDVSETDADYVSLSDISLSGCESGEIVSKSWKLARKGIINVTRDELDANTDQDALVSREIKLINPLSEAVLGGIKVTVVNNNVIEEDLRTKLMVKKADKIVTESMHDEMVKSRRKKKKRRRHRRSSSEIETDDEHLEDCVSRSPIRFAKEKFRLISETSSESYRSLGAEEQRYGILRENTTTSHLGLIKSPSRNHRTAKKSKISRRSKDRYRSFSSDEDVKLEHDKTGHRRKKRMEVEYSRLVSVKSDRSRSRVRPSADENLRLIIKDSRDRIRHTRSVNEKEDDRNRRRIRSPRRNSDDESSRKSFHDERRKIYKRSPKRDLDEKHDRYRWRRKPSRSPKRSSRSPKLSSRSPKLSSRSPKLSSRSPKRSSRSPKRSSRSPKRSSRSPKRSSRSPKRSPKRSSRSPKRSPKRSSRSPKRSPKRSSRSPKRSPKRSSRSPKRSPKRSSDNSRDKYDLDMRRYSDEDTNSKKINRSRNVRRQSIKRLSAEKEYYRRCENRNRISSNPDSDISKSPQHKQRCSDDDSSKSVLAHGKTKNTNRYRYVRRRSRSRYNSHDDSAASESSHTKTNNSSSKRADQSIIEVIDLDDEDDKEEDNHGISVHKETDDNDQFGVAIEVSDDDDDDLLRPPPPPVISLDVDLKHPVELKVEKIIKVEDVEQKEMVIESICSEKQSTVENDLAHSFSGLREAGASNVSSDFKEINISKDTVTIKDAEKNLVTQENVVVDAPTTICDLTEENVLPVKPLEENDLNELQKIRTKLENEMGLSGGLLHQIVAINSKVPETVPCEPPEQISSLQEANVVIAQPSPKDPRLNRPVPTVVSSQSNVAPPPPLIPKLTAAVALPTPSTSFVQVPYQNVFTQNTIQGQNISQEIDGDALYNKIVMTYGEYRREKRMQQKKLIPPKRRKSMAEWDKELDEASSNSSDQFNNYDSDSSGSESSCERSRKPSKRSKKLLDKTAAEGWFKEFLSEESNIEAILKYMAKKSNIKAYLQDSTTTPTSVTESTCNVEAEEPPTCSTEPPTCSTAPPTCSTAPPTCSTAPPVTRQPAKKIVKPVAKPSAKTAAMHKCMQELLDKRAKLQQRGRGRTILPGPEPEPMGKRKIPTKEKKSIEKSNAKSIEKSNAKSIEKSNAKSIEKPAATSVATNEPGRKDPLPKRMNELDKLNSDIAENMGDDIISTYGRRTSSINSEIRTKQQIGKPTRQQNINRIVSSDSESEATQDKSKEKVTPIKKLTARRIEDDDTDEYTPPPHFSKSVAPSNDSNINLLTPLRETPFSDKRKREKKKKSAAGAAKKQKKATISKNTDISLHVNSPNHMDCVICKEKQQQIVVHYVNAHRETEVFISRLDTNQVKDLMAKPLYGIPAKNSNVKFNGTCVFCLRVIKDTMANFMEHFGSHTGEFAYECDTCSWRFAHKRNIASHCNSACKNGAKPLSVYSYDLSNNIITAYVCNLCNYIQLNCANVVKHLRTEHNQQNVTTNDYCSLTILEIRENIEEIENDEEDIEVDIEVANEAIEPEAIEPAARIEDDPFTSDENSQADTGAIVTEEAKDEITFDESDLKSLELILKEPEPIDSNDATVTHVPKLEPMDEEESEIIFVVETASDSNNYQSSIKYQKNLEDVKPITTEVHTSIIDDKNTKSSPMGSVDENSNESETALNLGARNEADYDMGQPSDTENDVGLPTNTRDDNTVIDFFDDATPEPATLTALSLPEPSASSARSNSSRFDDLKSGAIANSDRLLAVSPTSSSLSNSTNLQDPTISRVMNVGFQKSSTNEYKYYCLFENCSFLSTENIAELRIHVNTSHDRKWGGKCNMCPKRITKKPTTLDKEINHLVSQHIQKKVAAPERRRSSNSSSYSYVLNILKPWLTQTKSRKTKEICNVLLKEYHLNCLYKCMGLDCLFTTASSSDMQDHITLKHSDFLATLECCYCEESFSIGNSLVDHITRVHGSSIYQCSHCFYRSRAAYNVQLHQKLLHEDQTNTKILVSTARQTPIPIVNEIMNILENRQKNIKPIECPGCRERFFVKQFLIDHIKKKHPNLTHTEFYCATYDCLYCTFGTTEIISIRQHMCNTHPCQLLYVCGRVFIKERQPLALQSTIDTTSLKTTCLVFIGFTVNKKKLQNNLPDEQMNLIAGINSGGDPAKLNEKIRITYGESVFNFNDIETYMKNVALGIQPTEVEANSEYSELDQLVIAATVDTGLVGNELYRCGFDKCEQSCSNFNKFDRHISTHSNDKKTLVFICPHCNEKIPATKIRLHTIKHRRHRYLCYYCGDSSPSQALAIDHLKIKHSEQSNVFVYLTTDKRWANEQESKIFVALSRLETDNDVYETMTNVLRKRYGTANHINDETENIVEEPAAEPEDLPLERKEQTNIPVFVALDSRMCCNIDECKFKAKSDDEIFQHITERHRVIMSGKYSCPHCPYELNHASLNVNRIKNHLQFHGPTIHVCDVCNFYNYNRNTVLKHIENCHPYNFVVMNIHTRSSFGSKTKIEILYSNLIRSAEDKYKCTLCDAILTECDELYMHMKALHKLKVRFKCDYCPFLDNVEQAVKIHVKASHKNKTVRIRSLFLPESGKSGRNLSLFELLVNSTSPGFEPIHENPIPSVSASTEKKAKLAIAPEESSLQRPSTSEKRKSSSSNITLKSDVKRSRLNEPAATEEDSKPVIQCTDNISIRKSEDSTVTQVVQSSVPGTAEEFIIKELPDPPAQDQTSPPITLKLVPLAKLMNSPLTDQSTNVTVQQDQIRPPLRIRFPTNIELPDVYFVCHLCEEKHSDINSLYSHWEVNHRGNPFHFRVTKKLLCAYCHYENSFTHLKAHHSECHATDHFITREALNHTKCAECSFNFSDITELCSHSITLHPNMYRERHSSFEYLNQKCLDMLLKLDAPSELFKCLICNTVYPKVSTCEAHIQRTHKPNSDGSPLWRPLISNKLLYGCHKCLIFFEQEILAIKHIRKHVQPYGCSECEMSFDNHVSLKYHYQLLHKTERESYRTADILNNLQTFKDMLLLFPNGLILSKAEVEFNDYGKLDQFVQMIESIEKTKLKLWIDKEQQQEVARIMKELEMEGNNICPP